MFEDCIVFLLIVVVYKSLIEFFKYGKIVVILVFSEDFFFYIDIWVLMKGLRVFYLREVLCNFE